MKLRRVALAVLAVAALGTGTPGVAADASPAPEQESLLIETADVSAYPQVTLELVGPAGIDGSGFLADAFTVTEAGSTVAATVERIETADLEVLLVIDTSGSMRGEPLEAAKRAAGEFLAVLPADVRAGVVGFGPQAVLLAPPSTDRAALGAAVDDLVANGDTALYDAVVFSVDQFTEAAEERAVVVLSDGGDTASFLDLAAATEAAGSGVRLSVVSLVTETTNAEALEQIAAAGDGSVSAVTDPAGLADLFRRSATALVNRYRVTYTSTGAGEVPIAVTLATAFETLSAVTTVVLPAPPPTTAPPTTRAAPVTAAATMPTAPPTTPAPRLYETPEIDPNRARLRLAMGAGAVFVALFAVVLLAMPRDRESRRARANLAMRGAHSHESALVHARDRLTSTTDHLIERTGQANAVARALDAAGLTISPSEYVALTFAVAVFAALAGTLLGGPLVGVGAVLLVALLARVLVRWLADQRREKFLEQLPDTLQVLTSTLRSGYGLIQALDSVAGQAEQPTRAELKRIMLEHRVGRDLVVTMQALAERMRSKDMEWVASALEINRDVGGDLAEILDNVAATIRERRRLARQVRSLSAEGRISAYVLLGLPVAVGGLMAVLNPEYVAAFGEPVGVLLLAGCAVFMTVGWFWMRRLVKVEF